MKARSEIPVSNLMDSFPIICYNERSYIYVGNATVRLLSDTFLFWSFNLRPLSIKSFLIDWFTFKISLALIFDFSLIKETKVGVISKKIV